MDMDTDTETDRVTDADTDRDMDSDMDMIMDVDHNGQLLKNKSVKAFSRRKFWIIAF
jgi:hypothetical protein